MLRKKFESESGIRIRGIRIRHWNCGFRIFYEKPADSGSRIRIAIPGLNTKHLSPYHFNYVARLASFKLETLETEFTLKLKYEFRFKRIFLNTHISRYLAKILQFKIYKLPQSIMNPHIKSLIPFIIKI